MKSYPIEKDEVILYETIVILYNKITNIKMILTNKRLIFSKEKGLFIKKYKVIENIQIENIKVYKDKVQIKQKNSTIEMQTTTTNIKFTCKNFFEARNIYDKIINLKTNSNILNRTKKGINKATNTFKDFVDTVGSVVIFIGLAKKLGEHKKEITEFIKTVVNNIKKRPK